jgi:uncharacterized protein YabN with tetrapyrrole methylase and pyrophosphatase domain
MTAKEEAKEIYNELSQIEFTQLIEFETGFSDINIDLPDWIIKKIAIIMINRMPHVENSITIDYYEQVKQEIEKL